MNKSTKKTAHEQGRHAGHANNNINSISHKFKANLVYTAKPYVRKMRRKHGGRGGKKNPFDIQTLMFDLLGRMRLAVLEKRFCYPFQLFCSLPITGSRYTQLLSQVRPGVSCDVEVIHR